MAYITLSPSPTIFDKATTVTATQDPRVASVVFTTDGSAPTLAKNLAYDTLNPPNPFISVVQDGKGNCLFDGGFPKWYNHRWGSNWKTFNDLNNTYKYFYNALDFIAKPGKAKKVLFIGDNPKKSDGTYPDYHVKDEESGNGFGRSIKGLCPIAGYTYTIIAPEDFPNNLIDLSYSYLDQFCGVVLFGSLYTYETRTISQGTINNLIAFREAGHGIFIITDHGAADGSGGFFYNSNLLARELGAEFRDNYDRTPVSVGYLIDNYGNHTLWKNMSRDETIYAGGSESRVVITERPVYSKAPNVTINKNGWTTVRYLVILNDGSMHIENYTYGLNVDEFVFFTSSTFPTLLNNETVDYNVNFPGGHDADEIQGIIRHNDSVIGEFTRTRSSLSKRWITANQNKIYPKEGDNIEILITSPFSYFKSQKVRRVQPSIDAITLPRLHKQISVHELKDIKQKDFVKNFHGALNIRNWLSPAKKIKELKNYILN